ncbi:hypothetical protein DID75_01675 [Candidatus Marinamargulisbacteria bacterium SCGC AG-410-N11]|nr:hypothetical protein DID75_01675 [Candidatus Marinamargulisbacteria bacterium SCGC AG-410-N11]
MNTYYITLDIGGTKIASGIIYKSTCFKTSLIKYIYKTNTKKGLSNIINSIVHHIQHLRKKAALKHWPLNSNIIIGCAGNYCPNIPGLILPGSAFNLTEKPNEFDNINLKNLLENTLNNNVTINIKNDGLTQLCGALVDLSIQGKLNQSVNQVIGYIGPGTGLGGGFAKIIQNNQWTFITNSQIYDIELINPKNNQPENAEDLFSGRAFFESTKHTAKDVNQSTEKLIKHTPTLHQYGHHLASLIQKIYNGTLKKRSTQKWSPQEIQSVKGTSLFVLGGSLLTKPPLSSIIIKKAQKLLKEKQLHIQLFPIKDSIETALKSAFYFC